MVLDEVRRTLTEAGSETETWPSVEIELRHPINILCLRIAVGARGRARPHTKRHHLRCGTTPRTAPAKHVRSY
jgi:hypothetical protein